MKVLAVSLLAAFAAPADGSAQATLAVREVPLRGERALAAARLPQFDLVGLHWRGSGDVLFRTRSTRGRWSSWHVAAPEREDLPEATSREARAARGWRVGNPYWTGLSDRIAYRLRGDVRRLRAYLVRSPADSVPARKLSAAGLPPIVPRRAWGADETITRGPPRYATAVRFAVVHHTAGSNTYTQAQSAAVVRAIQLYHVRGNGWNDVGYNFLVDKYGQVFEGRAGGIDRAVVGAHAQGFNTGSVGVALLGNYDSATPSQAARTALQQLLAWRLDVAHVDPLSSLTWPSGGNPRYPPGTPVFLRAVSGHRDTGPTSCPGSRLYAQLGALARAAAAIGLPKLYDPAVRGALGSDIRFTGRLSSALPWSVTVADDRGTQVAAGSGTGTAVDWTWPAAGIQSGGFQWTIEAGPAVRGARGRIGSAAAALTLTQARARPRTITPNGDSRADSTEISYVLSRPATVTATLHDLAGTQIAALFSGSRPAGRNAFRFAATGVPDGAFLIQLVARIPSGREARATVTVIVDRTLAGFEAFPTVFSPNGDGRLDTVAFRFVLTTRADTTLRIYRRRALVATVFSGLLEAGSQTLSWNGRGSRGRVRDGGYRATVSVDGPLGTRVQETPFAVDTRRPTLRLVSLRSLRFWVDEPVRVSLVVNGRDRIVQSSGRGYFRVSYPSAVRRVSAVAADPGMNRSRVIRAPSEMTGRHVAGVERET